MRIHDVLLSADRCKLTFGIGGLLSLDSFVKTFPQIDTVHITTANGFSQSEANHVSLIQGISVASYNLVRDTSISKSYFLLHSMKCDAPK